MSGSKLDEIKRLINVVAKLRAPDGCPWDREQTHQTLKQHLIEETYEVVDAIDNNCQENLKEELGDMLLHIVLHSQIASESGTFDIEEVAKGISDKIIRRHPHVFGEITVKDSEEVMQNWEEIKKQEKPERTSALAGVSKAQPALMTAQQLSKKAVKVGFGWPSIESLWKCFESEIQEFKDELPENNFEKMEEEFGDMLFCMVNLARWHKIDAELALIKANKKFTKRFQQMEELSQKSLSEYTQEELENLWNEAKKQV